MVSGKVLSQRLCLSMFQLGEVRNWHACAWFKPAFFFSRSELETVEYWLEGTWSTSLMHGYPHSPFLPLPLLPAASCQPHHQLHICTVTSQSGSNDQQQALPVWLQTHHTRHRYTAFWNPRVLLTIHVTLAQAHWQWWSLVTTARLAGVGRDGTQWAQTWREQHGADMWGLDWGGGDRKIVQGSLGCSQSGQKHPCVHSDTSRGDELFAFDLCESRQEHSNSQQPYWLRPVGGVCYSCMTYSN